MARVVLRIFDIVDPKNMIKLKPSPHKSSGAPELSFASKIGGIYES
jgi:hypothetical protein